MYIRPLARTQPATGYVLQCLVCQDEYCTSEEGGRAWTDGAHSGAVGVWDFVHYFLVPRFKQKNLLTLQIAIHAFKKKQQENCKYQCYFKQCCCRKS